MDLYEKKSKFFSTRKLADRTTLIRGTSGENAYLLEGDTDAVLIDSLTGAGNLAAFVRELTELPVTVILTHGHADHSGGCFDFGKCFMHPGDIRPMYNDTYVGHRKEHVENSNGGKSLYKTEDFTPQCAIRTYPIKDGDIFDLGNRQLEVIEVPGHSPGSVAFLERAARNLYSGDCCSGGTLLYLNDSLSIAEYLKGLHNLKKYVPFFDEMWSGHGDEPFSPCIVEDGIGLCERILDGSDDGEEAGFYKVPFYRARKLSDIVKPMQQTNVLYRKDWIRQAPANPCGLREILNVY